MRLPVCRATRLRLGFRGRRVRALRNPIYLASSLLQIGVAFWLNSLWVLVAPVPAIGLMSFVVIPREEGHLQIRFSDYLSYKASG